MPIKTSKQWRLNLRDIKQSFILTVCTTFVASISQMIYDFTHTPGLDWSIFKIATFLTASKLALYAGIGDIGKRLASRSKLIWTKLDKSTVEAVESGEIKPVLKLTGTGNGNITQDSITSHKTEQDMAEKLGVATLKSVLDFAFDMGEQYETSAKDGFNWKDSFAFLPTLLKVPGIIASGTEIVAELKDLDDTEREELYQYAKAKFDLTNDRVEEIVEAALAWGLATVILIEKVRKPASENTTV